MFRTIRTLALAVTLVALAALPAFSQAALNTTTLSKAITADDTVFELASVTNVAANDLLVIDGEAFKVVSNANPITVIRGVEGTRARAHVNASTVFSGVPARFANYVPSGSCTRTSETALPRVVVGGDDSGKVYDCYASEWRNVSQLYQGTKPSFPVGAAIFAASAPDAAVFDEDFLNEVAASDAIPNWTTTLVEAGGGESTVTIADGDAGELTLTTDAADNDGISIQKTKENFKFSTSQRLTYFGIRLKIDDVTQSDFLVGLCITDTTLLGGMTDGVYFEKLDGGATISAVTEKDSTETQTDSLFTVVVNTYVTLEFVFNGKLATPAVEFYVDGTFKKTHTTNIPDDELLTPSIEFLTGDATASIAIVDRVRAVQIGR